MPMTPWGVNGWNDPTMQPAAAAGGAPPAGPGAGPAAPGGPQGHHGMMAPWLQGLAQRIAAARAQWQQRMPHLGGGMPGQAPGAGGMGMPWGSPTPAAAGAPAGVPPAGGMGGGMFAAPGWADRFSGAAGRDAQPAAVQQPGAATAPKPAAAPADNDADDEKEE